MKTQSRILLSVVSSVAISVVIAFIAFAILQGANTELIRRKLCGDVVNQTYALNILTVSFQEGGSRSDIRQIKEVLLALDTLLKKMHARVPREQALVRQLQENHQELGPLVDRMLVSGQAVGGMEGDRNILASQVQMKAQFISDDANQLMNMSRTRIIAAQKKAGVMVIALIVILALTNGAIYLLSGRGIVRSQEALRESEERYRHLLKYAPTGIYEVDFVNKRFKSVNEVMCQALGYTEEEFLSMNPFDFLDEDGKKTFAERMRKNLAGEKVNETVEYRINARNGCKFWTALNVAFICEEGRTAGALVVAHDITERKKAEEILRNNEAQLAKVNQIMSGILEHTHMLAALLDSQFNFVWVNRAYAAAGRHDPSFFPGKNHFDLYPKEDNKWVFQRVVDTGEPFFVAAKPFEYPDQPERGVTYWDWSLVPVKDGSGRVSNLVFTLMEVTEQVRAQEGLRKAHDELELRVKERTAELERKNRELQEFAYVASHDLAEPLRKIQTFGDLLKVRSADRLRDMERDYVSRMTGAAVRMQELLDALLNYSRVETQARDLVPVNLEDVVWTVTSDLEVPIRSIGARVEIGPLPIINGDPYQWRQVFQNLIGNSAKYHRSEVKPFIKIYGEESEGVYRILVEDNGIGFDEKYLDRIFEPFQRLHGKHQYPGTGIGLAICKKIVERHGGTITARSIPGEGSTFIVTLPVTLIKA